MVAGRQDEAREGARPQQGHVVGRAGPEAGDRLDELELGDVGEDAVGLAQQLVHGAGGDRGVEALLLDRGAQRDAAVGAGDDVDVRRPDAVPGDALAARVDEVDDLALDGAHRRSRGLGQPGGAPGAGREHRERGVDAGAARRDDAAQGSRLDDRLGYLVARQHVHAGQLAGAQQRRAGLPRVYLALVPRQDAAAAAGREAWLQLAGLRGGDPLDRKVEPGLEGVQAADRFDLVAVEPEVEDAAAAEAGGEARDGLELGREGLPALVAREGQGEQLLLAELGLGGRREHAGPDPRGLPARDAALDDDHALPTLRQAPRDRQPDDARADHHDVRRDLPAAPLACCHLAHLPAPA